MNWIKNRYDQVMLAVVAVALLVFAGMVVFERNSFQSQINHAVDPAKEPVGVPDRDPNLPVGLASVPAWNVVTNADGSDRAPLFVSPLYFINKLGKLEKDTGDGSLRTDSLTGRSIPDAWFKKYNLSYTQGNVTLQDPDKDGFTNEDEWREGTDPSDTNSHPPYHTKLFLKQVVRTPFHVTFGVWYGNPDKPETMEFQINTRELKQPSVYVKMGEMIPHTKFKLDRFEKKQAMNEQIKEWVDVSELTIVNTESSEPSVLVLRKATNIPEEYAVFDYQWPPAAGDIRVKRFQQFGLKPQTDKNKLYKLIDIRESEAVIQTPDQRDYRVVRDFRQTAK